MTQARKHRYNICQKSDISARTLAGVMAIGLMIGLAGCSGNFASHKYGDGNPQLVASPDKASLLLAQAADKASNALETLAAIEQARTPAASVAPIENVPVELTRAMTISWVGPTEPIARTLANHADYEFVVLGVRPPVPIVVTLEAENTRVVDLLRNIGLQLGSRADVRVDAAQRVVELQYAPIFSGAGG